MRMFISSVTSVVISLYTLQVSTVIIIIIIIIFKDYRRPEGPLVWNNTLHIKYYIQLIRLFLISLALIINFPNR